VRDEQQGLAAPLKIANPVKALEMELDVATANTLNNHQNVRIISPPRETQPTNMPQDNAHRDQ
jgi:hypothetical protein